MRKLVQPVILVAAAASLSIAQQAPPQTQVKSGKGISKQEADGYNAINKAQTPDEKMKAVDEFVTKFADSQFKGLALNMAAQAADQKGDYQKAIIYGDEALQADPTLFETKLLVAGEIAQHTGQNDLDKDEKLAKAEKYVKEALDAMPSAPKPQPTVKDADWDAYKKYETARAHLDLGLIAQARKKTDQQIAEFKMAAEMMDPPDPVVLLRLAIAYDDAGKTDDGLQVLNQLLAMPDLNPRVKDIATQEKARAEKAKK